MFFPKLISLNSMENYVSFALYWNHQTKWLSFCIVESFCFCYVLLFLAYNLEYYTEVMDLNYLVDQLKDDVFTSKYKKLNDALVGLVQDYSLVSFLTLNIQVIKGKHNHYNHFCQ